MKYSDFTREVKALGLKVRELDCGIEVRGKHNNLTLFVHKDCQFAIGTDYREFNHLDNGIKESLFNLAIELAKTPLDEREDEKRYRLKIDFIDNDWNYLNVKDKNLRLDTPLNYKEYQTIFTESEIEELKQKYNLDSFIMEEVEE